MGVAGSQWASHRTQPVAPSVQTPASAGEDLAQADTSNPGDTAGTDIDLEGFTPSTLRAFDEATPRLMPAGYAVASVR